MGEWKPLLEGYDFLKLMDEGKKAEDMDTSVTNEYGVGERNLHCSNCHSTWPLDTATGDTLWQLT